MTLQDLKNNRELIIKTINSRLCAPKFIMPKMVNDLDNQKDVEATEENIIAFVYKFCPELKKISAKEKAKDLAKEKATKDLEEKLSKMNDFQKSAHFEEVQRRSVMNQRPSWMR